MKATKLLGLALLSSTMIFTSCGDSRMTMEQITEKATAEFNSKKEEIKKTKDAECEASMEDQVSAWAKKMMDGEYAPMEMMEMEAPEMNPETMTDEQMIAAKADAMVKKFEAELDAECNAQIEVAAKAKMEEMKAAAAASSSKKTTPKKETDATRSTTRTKKAEEPKSLGEPEPTRATTRKKK